MPNWNEWLRCDDGLPVEKCASYRRLWLALDPDEQRAFIPQAADVPEFPAPVGKLIRMRPKPVVVDFNKASVGLGDVVGKLLKRTGLDQPAIKLLKRITGDSDCKCRARQIALNERIPLPGWWQSSVGWWLRAWM